MTYPSSSTESAADDVVVQLALDAGIVQPSDVEAAKDVLRANEASRAQGGLMETLVARGATTSRRIAELLAREFGYEVAPDLRAVRISPELAARVPRAMAARYRMFVLPPENGRWRVAVANPLDTDGVDALMYRLSSPVDVLLASSEEIQAAIERCYGKETATLEEVVNDAPLASVQENSRLLAATTGGISDDFDDAPIIALVQSIMAEAIRRGASDIHLEPLATRFRVRFRIDGVLLELEGPSKRLQLSMISRLKIMANISIAEKRLPQDGRIQVTVDGRPIDLRVSSLPTAHGESIVMRILDQDSIRLGLTELGFVAEDRNAFERLIAAPDGMLLVTGPTGSGKTTTLYSCLHHINQPDRKIITVEDPVEYQLTGINQVPVRHGIGMTFASALRAMLRQAPNVVMVGEVRDLETAEIAINASLTGHMVFSTLHTNDAAGAVTRLVDLGVKPFLVATALRAVVAQRLVRKVCPDCRRAHVPAAWELRALGLKAEEVAAAHFAKGAGCPRCHGTGYRGRMGIFEIMVIDDELQRMIHARASTAALRDAGRRKGMRTMREDGLRKAIAGLTTVEEVVSITVGDTS